MLRLVLLLILVATLVGVKAASRFYWKTPQYAMPWLKGPNVCAVEEVVGSRKRYYSECMAYMPRKICQKPTFIRYHCCSGYEKLADEDSKGCQGVAPMLDMMGTTDHLYLREFRKHVEKAALEPYFQNEGPITLFAPQNKAFHALDRETRLQLNNKNKKKNLLMHQVTNNRYFSQDLYNDMKLPSLYSGNSTIHVNRYSNGIVTANCARVIKPNQVATNGILHVTEKLIEPVKEQQTVLDILLNDSRLGELVTALIVTTLGNDLRDENKFFTVFAPTDAAFRNAPNDVVERMLDDPQVLERILKYHILDKSVCSAAILGPTKVKTREGQKVNMSCDINDQLLINGKRTIKTDIVGTNGVVHILNDVLLPSSAKSLKEKLIELKLDTALEYIQGAGGGDILDGKAKGNFTIFAPSQEAFDKLTAEQRRLLKTQPAVVKKVFQYHIVPGKVTTKQFVGTRSITSNSGPTAKIRVNVFNKGFGINGAKITSSDHQVGNGVIHVIDKVLFPPEGVTLDKIKEDSKFSTFFTLLQTAGMEKLLLNPDGDFTVFAPTNDAFDAMESSYLERLMTDTEELKLFLQYHVLSRTIYTSAIQPTLQYRYKTTAKEWIKMSQTSEDDPILINGESKILGEAIETTNGAVYAVDQVLRCPCLTTENEVQKRKK